MLDLKKLKSKRRLIIFGGASVFIHAVALALLLNHTYRTPSVPELTVEFDTPEKPEAPVKKAVRQEPVKTKAPAQPPRIVDRSGSPGVASRKGVPQKAPSRSRNLEAILATDLQSLRADLAMPAAFAKGATSTTDGLSPVDPDIHLTDGAIDRLVAEGRGYADTGKKRRRRGIAVGMGGGGGGSCK